MDARRVVTASLLLAGVLGLGPPAPLAGAQPASPVTTPTPTPGGGAGPHGAMPMGEQLSRIAALVSKPPPKTGAPAGIDPAFYRTLIPADNATTDARVALGRRLYFEPRLSRDGTVACATCHDVSRAFTDRRGTSEGVGEKLGQRNAPTIMNAFLLSTQFWDGRAATLEEQAKLPITNPIEMGMPDGAAAVGAIQGDPAYREAFQAAYGRAPNFDDIGRAIAAFERTLVFLDAPFDRFQAGDPRAIDDDAKAGWALFNTKARCATCHAFSSSSPIGTDNRFHNVGVAARHRDFAALARSGEAALAKDGSKDALGLDKLALQTDLSELGRFVVTRSRSDIGAFRSPQLRNVGLTGPYMHDGSMMTLWDVIDHYNKGGEPSAYLDGGIEPLALGEKEIDQLVAFLFSLTDTRFAAEGQAELARQRRIAAVRRPLRDEARARRERLPFERPAAAEQPGPRSAQR